jgi:hypothetical protein
MCGRITATFEFSDIRVRWNLDRDLPHYTEGSALPVHPVSPDWYVGGSVLVPGCSTSIVEITRAPKQLSLSADARTWRPFLRMGCTCRTVRSDSERQFGIWVSISDSEGRSAPIRDVRSARVAAACPNSRKDSPHQDSPQPRSTRSRSLCIQTWVLHIKGASAN